jgi:hypothetical protein
MRLHALCCALSALILAAVAIAGAQESKPKPQAVIDAAQADADFAIQGEYSGELAHDDGARKFGVQVIALGDGKFHAVGYPGGLPGDGWNKEEKVEADGEARDAGAVFKSDKGMGVIDNGTLVVTNLDGQEVGRLKKVVRKSPTLGKAPPAGAVVLFDGTTADNFDGGRLSEDKLLMEGVTSKRKFQDFTLHLEFLLSYMPHARGQGRSNSGCYMQGRYEVQILDSFGLKGEHNECGGIYSVKAPDVNMCFPPLSWQTFDVDYTAPRYDDAGHKTANARLTVRHNGVVIHDNVEVPKTTTAAPVAEGSDPGPIYIQNHGNPLRFRNIWVVEK